LIEILKESISYRRIISTNVTMHRTGLEPAVMLRSTGLL